MKKLFLILTTVLTVAFAFGQSIQAGDTTSGFYHATYSPSFRIQDTIYDYATQNVNNVVAIDIDGDSINDLSLISSYYQTNAGSYYYPVWRSGLILDSLTDAITISSSYNNADTLNNGDAINNLRNWYSGNVQFCQNINNYTLDSTWKDKNTYFVGLRIRKLTGDTLFGWLRINVENYNIIYLVEHACQSLNPKDTMITLNTSKNDALTVKNENHQIFPNPFSSSTTLKTDYFFNNATLTITNCFGQTVQQVKNVSGQTFVLTRENLVNGLYFVRMTEENKTILENKLVITDN